MTNTCSLLTALVDQADDVARVGGVWNLEVPGDERSVAEEPPGDALLHLDRVDPLEADRRGAPPNDAVDDEELLGRDDDARPLPPNDGPQGPDGAKRERGGAGGGDRPGPRGEEDADRGEGRRAPAVPQCDEACEKPPAGPSSRRSWSSRWSRARWRFGSCAS